MTDKIVRFQTHYEIYNYIKGDCVPLERDLSLWDNVYFKEIPKYYLDEVKNILYVPRGYKEQKLRELFDCGIGYARTYNKFSKISYKVTAPPRNDLQKESIRFMMGQDDYRYNKDSSQMVLSLATGEGKTYCATTYMSLLGVKTMVIVNTDQLRKQWISSLKSKTTLSDGNIVEISSTAQCNKMLNCRPRDLNGHIIYIVTHSTLRNFMKEDTSLLNELMIKLGIGLKIIDEAHLEYSNILMLDYFSEVYKTVYLSATFARSDKDDDKVFQNCFNEVFKFNKKNEEKRKHVIYIPILYNSKPSTCDRTSVKGLKGFNSKVYIDYAIKKEAFLNNIRECMNLYVSKKLEGKVFILSPKKESCDLLAKFIQEEYPDFITCSHHSSNKQDDLSLFDIICATPKMLGTGMDLPGLRMVINTEPMRSKVNTIQIVGRLREYDKDKDTFYFELVDKGFYQVTDMYKDRSKVITEIAKKVIVLDKTKKK